MIKAMDIHEHLRERGEWVDWERTTDTFKAGDPKKPVGTVAVAWKPNSMPVELELSGGAGIHSSLSG